jgi:hypothetical protein
MATQKIRVEKLETAQGGGEEDQVYELPGLEIRLQSNLTAFAIYDADLVSAPFVETMIRQQFPDARAMVILPDNHRGKTLEEALPYLEKAEYHPR